MTRSVKMSALLRFRTELLQLYNKAKFAPEVSDSTGVRTQGSQISWHFSGKVPFSQYEEALHDRSG